jgi:hypothetical protein
VQRIGVAGALSGPVRAAVLADGPATGTRVELLAEPSGQAAAADLRGGRIDLAVVDGREVVVAKATSATGTSATAQLTQAVARTVVTGDVMRAAGLTRRRRPPSRAPGRFPSRRSSRAARAPPSGTPRSSGYCWSCSC